MTEEERSRLIRIMTEIKKQPDGLEEFRANPLGYLTSKGINTEGLSLAPAPNPPGVTEPGDVTDADLSMVAGGACFSIGYYVCYMEG